MDSEEFHFKFKVAVLGDKHVGKSTLVDTLSTNHGQVLEVEVSEEYSWLDTGSLSKPQPMWRIRSFTTSITGRFLAT